MPRRFVKGQYALWWVAGGGTAVTGTALRDAPPPPALQSRKGLLPLNSPPNGTSATPAQPPRLDLAAWPHFPVPSFLAFLLSRRSLALGTSVGCKCPSAPPRVSEGGTTGPGPDREGPGWGYPEHDASRSLGGVAPRPDSRWYRRCVPQGSPLNNGSDTSDRGRGAYSPLTETRRCDGCPHPAPATQKEAER